MGDSKNGYIGKIGDIMELKELEKKLDENSQRIIDNIKNIEDNSKRIDNNFEKIQQNSYALDILKDYKKGFNRWHTIAIIFMILWILTVGYLVYILNDIGTIDETTITQDNKSGYNNYIGNDGDIVNGETNNKKNEN